VYEYKELKQFMIRFTKSLSIFLCVLFFSNSNVYSAWDEDEILCGQWLWKKVLNKEGPCVNAPFCKVGSFNTSSGQEEVGAEGNQDYGKLTYYVSDSVGKKGICRDYFPDGLQREMFYRNSDDPLNMELKFVRQFCGWRWWDSTTNCGAPKTKGVWYPPFFEWDWSRGALNGDWTGEVNLTFSLQSRGPDNYQTVVWGLNYAYIDYDKTAGGKEDPTRVCVFYATSWLSGIFEDSEKIGCIDIPLNPAPNIYNKILIPKKSVTVAGGTPNGSTFMNPKINLQVVDSTGQGGELINLEYNYLDNSAKCSEKEKTLGDVYCPFVPLSEPTKICAGIQGKSSSRIGCVDRPKPSGSIIIDAVHDYYIDNNCPDKLNKPSIFHALKIQLKNSATKEVIKEFPENGLGLRDYYACYQQIPDPKVKDKLITSIIPGRDSANVYGVKFSAVIPKFVDNDGQDAKDYSKIGINKIRPQNFKKTYMYSLIAVDKGQLVNQSSDDGNCFVSVKDKVQCTDKTSTSKQSGESKCAVYNTPAGERERAACVRDYSCYDLAHHPLPMTAPMIDKSGKCPNCISYDFGSDLSKLNDAEKAYCPGIYKLNQDTEQNAICINLDTKWPDFFGTADQICAEIPVAYMELSNKDISSLTGYIDFTDDGMKKAQEDKNTERLKKPFYGKCDASLNLENKKCLSSDGEVCLTTDIPDQIKGLDKNQIIKFKGEYTIINQYLYGDKEERDSDAKGINANVQAIYERLLRNLGYTSSKQEFSTIDIPPPAGAPYRMLDGNFPIGTIYNGCRFTVGEDGCGVNTETVPLLGNAFFDASSLNLNIGSQLTTTKLNLIYSDASTGLMIKDILVEGKCEDGLAPASDDAPVRMCRVIVDKNNKIITKSWTDQVIINPCVKSVKPNE
jgi:hypothetical protein